MDFVSIADKPRATELSDDVEVFIVQDEQTDSGARKALRKVSLPVLAETLKGYQKLVSLTCETTSDLMNYEFQKDKLYMVEIGSDCAYEMNISEGSYIVKMHTDSDGVMFLSLINTIPNGKSYTVDTRFWFGQVVDNIDDIQNTYVDWFVITEDGELSLPPQYFDYLPFNLIIPEVVNEIAVNKLASGMFKGNTRIQSVTFPDTIDEIPDECFNECVNLRYLHNTEHIKKIGAKAFRWTRIEKAIFPSLEEFGVDVETGESLAFSNVPHLAYVDVGKVTTIPKETFKHCTYLSKIVGENVTAVDAEAFTNTYRLANVGFIKQLTSIGDYAFWRTKFEFDWGALGDDVFSEKSTYAQINPVGENGNAFWNEVNSFPCENPIPTKLCQQDPRWRDKQYGVDSNPSGKSQTYKYGCLQMSAMHAYCGLNNLHFSSVTEFEDVIKTLTQEGETVSFGDETYDNYLEAQNGTFTRLIPMLEKMGLYAQYYDDSSWNERRLLEAYVTLAKGGYIIINVDEPENHAALIYGINDKSELLVLDSERRYPYDESKAIRYKLPFNKLIPPSADFAAVALPVAACIYDIDTTTVAEKITFSYGWHCVDNLEFVKAGILAVNKDNYDEATLVADTEDSNVYERNPSGEYLIPANLFSWTKSSVASGDTWVAKAYVQYKDANGELQTVYSDLVEATKE